MNDASNGCAYYINNGHLKVIREGNEIALLGPGSFFGGAGTLFFLPLTGLEDESAGRFPSVPTR